LAASWQSQAARHFIFRGSSPKDALISKEAAVKMASDWLGAPSGEFFRYYPMSWVFEEAWRAFHGPTIIGRIFDLVNAHDWTAPAPLDLIRLQLEADRTAQAMLTHWGHQRNGFPSLDRGQIAFLRRLTLRGSEQRRATKALAFAEGYFSFNSGDVLGRLEYRDGNAVLRPS
jgi:hypothetical protein